MARIPIYVNSPIRSADSAGNRLPWLDDPFRLSSDVTLPTYSLPFRVMGIQRDISVVGYEFYFRFDPGITCAFRWWQEFYGDEPNINTPPARQRGASTPFPVPAPSPWMRESSLSDAGSGNLNHFQITRRMDVTVDSNQQFGASWYFPVNIHTLWARLAMWVSLADSTGIPSAQVVQDDILMAVWVHVGGHVESEYVKELGPIPYAYNAQTDGD